MPENYYPENAMQTEVEDQFDPMEPDEHVPWQNNTGSVMKPLTESQSFMLNLKKPADSGKEGFFGDAAQAMSRWAFGKQDDFVEQSYEERRNRLTPLQQELAKIMDIEEDAGRMESPAYNQALEMYFQEEERKQPEDDDFDLGAIVDAIRESPGEMGAEMINGITGNPHWAVLPNGGKSMALHAARAAKAVSIGVQGQKAAWAAGSTLGVAGLSAGIFTADALMDELGKGNDVDWSRVKDEAVMGAYFGIPFGAAVTAARVGAAAKGITTSYSRFLANLEKELPSGTPVEMMEEAGEYIAKFRGKGNTADGVIVREDETITQAADRLAKEIGLDDKATKGVIENLIAREVSAVVKADPDKFINKGLVKDTVNLNQEIKKEVFKQAAKENQVPMRNVAADLDLEQIYRVAKKSKDVKAVVRKAIEHAQVNREIRMLMEGAPKPLIKEMNKELKVLSSDQAFAKMEKAGDIKTAETTEQFMKMVQEETGFAEIAARGKPTEMTAAFSKALEKAKGLDDVSAKELKALLDDANLPKMLKEQAGATETMLKEAKDAPKWVNRQQAGFVSPKLAGLMAAAGLGYLFGDDAAEGVAYAAGAVAAVAVGPAVLKSIKSGAKNTKALFKKDGVLNALNRAETTVQQGMRHSFQRTRDVVEAVPGLAGREKITLWLEGIEKVTPKMVRSMGLSLKAGAITLNENELKVAKSIKENFKEYYATGIEAGILKEGTNIDKYVPHYWDNPMLEGTEVVGTKMLKTKTGRAEQRVYPTHIQGIEDGRKIWDTDIAKIQKRYEGEMVRTMANKKLVEELKALQLEDGNKLLEKSDDAPANYISMNHPQLAGLRVHPEMKDSLKFFFDTSDPSDVQKAILAVNFSSKRALVSTSLFHANALIESMLFAGVNPAGGRVKSALRMLREGGQGDMVDVALKSGLKIGTIEDVGTDIFYSGLGKLKGVMDKHAPIAGSAVKGFEIFNRKVDEIMWDRIATGGKLAVFGKRYEQALANPKYKHMSPDEIGATVAEFTNDAFGGLNWRRIAEGIDSKFGRKIAMSAFHPQGRRYMQMLMFAPDWTLSNARVLMKAIPGMSKNKLQAQLHQAYAARSAVLFLGLGTAMQSAWNGEFSPIWENQDPTSIDLGDGRKMAIFKQTSEVIHAGTDPSQYVLGKSGIFVKEAMTQLQNKKYLSAKGAPRLSDPDGTIAAQIGQRITHLAKNYQPIVTQAGSPQAAFWGGIGHPITGRKER